MGQESVRIALEALTAIGALRQKPPPASPAQEETFPAYAFEFRDRHTGLYWRKVMAAWREIAAHEYIPGAMQWAEKHHPDRYYRVTSELPAEWSNLWDEAAPLDEFQAALDRWVASHEELIGLFPVTRGTE